MFANIVSSLLLIFGLIVTIGNAFKDHTNLVRNTDNADKAKIAGLVLGKNISFALQAISCYLAAIAVKYIWG